MGLKVDRQPKGEVARQPEGEVARQAKFFQPAQPTPSPIRDRSGRPGITQDVFVVKGERSRSQEIDVKSFHQELCSSNRSGQPDITPSVIRAHNNLSEDIRVEQTHDRSGQPDNLNSQEAANSQNFIIGSDATEFVNRVSDEVRRRQKRMSNVAGSGEEHSKIW